MKLKTTHIIIVVLAIIIIFLSTCTDKPVEYIPIKIFRTDSLYIRTTDTFTNIVHVPIKSIPLTDTIYLNGLLNTYIYTEEDSLLSYDIRVDATVEPSNVRFQYDLKNFTIRDSVYLYVRDSVYQEAPIKSYVSFGGTILGGTNQFGVVPQLFYNHKSGNNIGLGYDPINQNIHITFLKKISFKK